MSDILLNVFIIVTLYDQLSNYTFKRTLICNRSCSNLNIYKKIIKILNDLQSNSIHNTMNLPFYVNQNKLLNLGI